METLRLWQDGAEESRRRIHNIRTAIEDAAQDPRRLTDEDVGEHFDQRFVEAQRNLKVSLTLVNSPAAVVDLDAIFDFIAADNSSRARTYVQQIQEACRGLF